MTAHAHRYILAKYERLIQKGTCKCGAVKFFYDDPTDSEVVARVKELNRTLGRDGNPDVIAKLIESQEKEESVPAKANYSDLNPETQKVVDQALAEDLVPVPPKPKGVHNIHTYYEENKEAILKDIDLLGVLAARERWGISSQTWRNHRINGKDTGLAVRWGLLPDKYKNKPGRKPSPFKRHIFFEKNKKAIIRDLKDLGVDQTKKNWGISKDAFNRMLKDWHDDLVAVVVGLLARSAGMPNAVPSSAPEGMSPEQELYYLRGWRDCFLSIMGARRE